MHRIARSFTRKVFVAAAGFAAGAMLLQTSGCADTASIVTAISTTAAAIGVFFVVDRVRRG